MAVLQELTMAAYIAGQVTGFFMDIASSGFSGVTSSVSLYAQARKHHRIHYRSNIGLCHRGERSLDEHTRRSCAGARSPRIGVSSSLPPIISSLKQLS